MITLGSDGNASRQIYRVKILRACLDDINVLNREVVASNITGAAD
jgi:hypothetical protein